MVGFVLTSPSCADRYRHDVITLLTTAVIRSNEKKLRNLLFMAVLNLVVNVFRKCANIPDQEIYPVLIL